MEFPELIQRRHSVRAYSAEPVDPVVLERILHAVSRAPSAGNLQAYRIDIVRNEQKRRALAMAAGEQDFLAQAPLDLVFFADSDRSAATYGKRGASLYAIQDATIAAAYAILAATNEGLSTAWVGAFDDSSVSVVCGERKLRPVAIVPVGYGAETPKATPRRPLDEIIHEV
jgi:nitroreductase